MPINGATILAGATVSASGGTSKTYTENGLKVQGGKQVVDTSQTDGRIRPTITVRSTPGQYNAAAGKYSNDRAESAVTDPYVMADGSIDFPTFRIIYTGNREISAAHLETLKSKAAQTIIDADFAGLWAGGATA